MLINPLRLIPFLILMIPLSSLTCLILGTAAGTAVSTVPFAIACSKTYGKQSQRGKPQHNRNGTKYGSISLAGAYKKQMIPENIPPLFPNAATAIAGILVCSAMSSWRRIWKDRDQRRLYWYKYFIMTAAVAAYPPGTDTPEYRRTAGCKGGYAKKIHLS